MISSYCEYIDRYVRRKSKSAPPAPGEHHFVSAYLVPKLYAINGKVPDYINPDGTKAILGDVVYYQNGKHHFAIEVKLGTVRLTKREFNEWIVSTDSGNWPDLFIGVGRSGVSLATWGEFRGAYIAAIRTKVHGWAPLEISSGYGPMKGVDELPPHLPNGTWFQFATSATEASEREAKFTTALRRGIGG